jgi:hypothetical protein
LLETAVLRLGLAQLLDVRQTHFSPAVVPRDYLPLDLAWIDCGHQLDYAGLVNGCWPLLDSAGGLLAIHYTHVDVDLPQSHGGGTTVISGPAVNEMKRQQLAAGPAARFELFSLVEPHKRR